MCYDNACTTHYSDKNESEWFSKSSKKAQQLQVTQKKKTHKWETVQEWIKKEEEWIKVKWSRKLSEAFFSNKEYEVVKSSDTQEEKLSEDQKTSHLTEFIKSVKLDHLEN